MRWTNEIKDTPEIIGIKFARYMFVARMLKPDDYVLSVGCGQGTECNVFAPRCKAVIGIDPWEEEIIVARYTWTKKNIAFCMKKLSNFLDYAPNVVSMIDVIEHMNRVTAEQGLCQIKGMLASRGIAVVGTPNKKFKDGRSPRSKATHVYEYTAKEFRRLMDKVFKRVLYFCMNDEVVYSGNLDNAYFMWGIGVR